MVITGRPRTATKNVCICFDRTRLLATLMIKMWLLCALSWSHSTVSPLQRWTVREWLKLLLTNTRRTQNPNIYDACNVCRCRWHWTTSVKLDLDLLSQMFYIGFRAVSQADNSSQPERYFHALLTYSVFVWSSWQGQRRQWIVLKPTTA